MVRAASEHPMLIAIFFPNKLMPWWVFNLIHVSLGIPAGPYTQQDGIWGYLEILQAFKNDTLEWLPEATPHNWTVVTDDCYDAPYACNIVIH